MGLFTFLLQFGDTGSEILQLCFTAATTNVFVDFRDSFRVAGHRRGSNAVKCEMPALFDSRWPLVPVCVSDLPSGSDSSAIGSSLGFHDAILSNLGRLFLNQYLATNWLVLGGATVAPTGSNATLEVFDSCSFGFDGLFNRWFRQSDVFCRRSVKANTKRKRGLASLREGGDNSKNITLMHSFTKT